MLTDSLFNYHLAQYSPKHSSDATLVNYRKIRESSMGLIHNQSEERIEKKTQHIMM